jgi:hypothetical protein
MIEIRGADDWGSGAFDAPRGSRKHKGIDPICCAGDDVCSLTYGSVSKLGWCYIWDKYPDRKHMRYVEVTLDGNRFRYLYVTPLVSLGDKVAPGMPLGSSIDLNQVFIHPDRGPITQHYHLEVITPAGDKINPAHMLPEVES